MDNETKYFLENKIILLKNEIQVLNTRLDNSNRMCISLQEDRALISNNARNLGFNLLLDGSLIKLET